VPLLFDCLGFFLRLRVPIFQVLEVEEFETDGSLETLNVLLHCFHLILDQALFCLATLYLVFEIFSTRLELNNVILKLANDLLHVVYLMLGRPRLVLMIIFDNLYLILEAFLLVESRGQEGVVCRDILQGSLDHLLDKEFAVA